MKWISITEKLPEVNQQVLCYQLEGGPEVGKYIETIHYSAGDANIFTNNYDEFISVSHWMEIPPILER